eukprot:24261-Eustigmatos_ZCMA.PRE.1
MQGKTAEQHCTGCPAKTSRPRDHTSSELKYHPSHLDRAPPGLTAGAASWWPFLGRVRPSLPLSTSPARSYRRLYFFHLLRIEHSIKSETACYPHQDDVK